MPSNEQTQKRLQRSDLPDNWFDGQKSYAVILDEVRADMETTESFAIKFSLLTKIPVTKTKHMIAKFPATIWTGVGRPKAERILSLVEEAGGQGRIIDGVSEALVRDSTKVDKSILACRWCGFPLKEGDAFCDFCMTPVQEGEKSGGKGPSEKKSSGITLRKLLIYVGILVVGIIIIISTR